MIEQALKNDYSALLPLLLSKETIDHPIRRDDAPLHVACHRKAHRCIKALLAMGATVDLPGRNGMSPLHYSILLADTEGEEILISKGADPVKRDNRGETPYSLPFRLGNRRGCRQALANWSELQEKLPMNKQELRSISYSGLTLPFLMQDAEWIQRAAKEMSREAFNGELASLKVRYPTARFDLAEDARLTFTREHLLELSTVAQNNLPNQEVLDALNLCELTVLFDWINLTDPDKQGYRNPSTIKDSNGHTFTPEELRAKLNTLISEVSRRIPKAGIPPLDLEACSEAFSVVYATLTNEKQESLSDLFSALQQYLDRNEPAPELSPLLESLHKGLTKEEIAPLLPFLEKIERFDLWYTHLENMLKGVLHLIKLEPFEDATPTIIELALMGDNCGGWYLGDATKLYEQKSGMIQDFRAQVVGFLGNFFKGIVENMVNPQDGQNRHHLSSLLCALDLNFGISDEEASKRPHFTDTLRTSYKVKDQEIEGFKNIYTPSMIINVIDEALNGENSPIDRELLVDWIKQNIPDTWKSDEGLSNSERSYTYLSEVVYDANTGKINRSYIIEMLNRLNIIENL